MDKVEIRLPVLLQIEKPDDRLAAALLESGVAKRLCLRVFNLKMQERVGNLLITFSSL
jgi:hypothetical protein